jgi:hypothetical protein
MDVERMLAPAAGVATSAGAQLLAREPRLTEAHLSAALDRVRKRSSADIAAPKIPNVR